MEEKTTIKEIKFLLLFYDKYIVEKIQLFQDEESLKKRLVTLLQKDRVESIGENNTIEEIMHIFNKRFNYDGGDFWMLVYKVDGKTASLVYNDL